MVSERLRSEASRWPAPLTRGSGVVVLLWLALHASSTGPATAAPAPAPASGSKAPKSAPSQGPGLARSFPSIPPTTKGAPASDLSTPRAAVQSYLIAARAARYRDAARYLDLSEVPEETRSVQGPRLAREMKIVLDQNLWIDLEDLSDLPEGMADDGLDPSRDHVGEIQNSQGIYEINVRRTEGPSGAPEWRFSPGTLHRVEILYAQVGYGPLLDWLPDWATQMRYSNVMVWQWGALFLLVVLSILLGRLLTRAVLGVVFLVSRRTDPDFRSRIVESARPPLRLGAMLAFVVIGAQWLRLSVPTRHRLGHVVLALVLVLVTWMVLRLIDFATARTLDKMKAQGRRSGMTTLVLIRRIAKAVTLVIAGLAGLQNLGFNITGLLAGFGIVGAAMALAAQKTLENVFGGLVLTADEPMRIGDVCRIGDKEGTVEDIGLRSTRIRTRERTVLAVPNALMSTIQIENLAMRDRIRLLAVLRLRYETTVEQLTAVLERIRRLLSEDARISPTNQKVRFVAFGDYSLDIEVEVYILTTDPPTFWEIREDLFLKIMRIVSECGTELAFPSQTLYMAGDQAPDANGPPAVPPRGASGT